MRWNASTCKCWRSLAADLVTRQVALACARFVLCMAAHYIVRKGVAGTPTLSQQALDTPAQQVHTLIELMTLKETGERAIKHRESTRSEGNRP